MATRLTSKGQVTIPKAVRDRLEIGPGDPVEFDILHDRVEIRKSERQERLRTAILALQRRRRDDGMSTDEYMALIRDEP